MTTVPATIQEHIGLPPSGGGPAEQASGVSVNEIISILRRRVVMITLLWLFFAMVAVGLVFLWYIYYPSYVADTWIECISNRPNEGETLNPQTLREDEHERFINSQAQLIKSPEVLSEVLKTPEVRSTSWYKGLDPNDRLLELEESLGSGPMRETNYIRVAIGCRDRKDPAKIVHQVAIIYLSLIQEHAKSEYRDQLKKYQDEQAALTELISGRNGKLDQIKEFTSKLPPGALTNRGGIIYEELALYAEQAAALELQTNELESLSQLHNDPGGPGISAQDWQLAENDPRVQMLANQRFAIEQELEILKDQFGAEHREVKRMQRRLDVIEDQLERVREVKLNEMLAYRREQIRTAFLNSQNAYQMAKEQLALAEAKQADLDRKLSEHQTLQDELELLKEQRARTLEFIREIERVVADQQTIQVSLAKTATDPLKRSSPSLLMLPVGVILALLLSMGLAMLLEFTDTSVRTPQDIVQHMNVPMLGVVPDVDDEEVPIDQVETAVRDAPQSMIVEAFRTLRTNLQFTAPADRQRTIVVTSPKPDDGKTTIASNLAAALAQGGRRVLLVDANFRRPALQRIYSANGEKGLSNLLIGEGGVDSCVCKTDIANLDLLFTGPIPPNPAERLASTQVREFLDAAVAAYDQVIIDAPPVLLASDATVLSTHVDGVIVVCRAKQDSRGAAQRCCDLLRRVNAQIFGAVLNAAQVRRGGYFREQMATFYDYRPDEALEADKRPALPADRDADADDSDPAEPDKDDEPTNDNDE